MGIEEKIADKLRDFEKNMLDYGEVAREILALIKAEYELIPKVKDLGNIEFNDELSGKAVKNE